MEEEMAKDDGFQPNSSQHRWIVSSWPARSDLGRSSQ